MSNKKVYTVPSALLFFSILSSTLTLLSFTFLSSHLASATDTSVDDITIAVPASCSLEGTNKEHTATINNGTYNSSIGLTTMKAYCNDPEGFAIYAIGYTNEEDGNNVLTSTTLGSTADIVTGIATSGNTSNWAMKLATITDPAPTYPITIENGFNNFHNVPDDYTLVAKRTASTDVGSAATGSTLTSTYQAYISPTQPAGTYNGKVKYVLVHPNTAPAPLRDDQVEIIFNGNGLTFPGGLTTNRVVYGESCTTEYGYIGTPQISKSENVTDRNTYTPIESGDYTNDTVTISGADKLKIVLHYDFDSEDAYDENSHGNIFVGDQNYNLDRYYYGVGDETLFAEGDTVYFAFNFWGTVDPDHDYGYYAEVYPIYEEETADTTYGEVITTCEVVSQSGTYAETTTWNYEWWLFEGESLQARFSNENKLAQYLKDNLEDLGGTTLHLYAKNYYTVVFDANGGSGTMESQQIYPYYTTTLPQSTLTKPHQDVVSWNTEADGTGESYSNSPFLNNRRVVDPIANAKGGDIVTLYAQWGACAPQSICYDDNGANNTNSTFKNTYSTNYPSLTASNFQRSNYGFAGWNTEMDGSGNTYGPNQNLDLSANDPAQEGVRFYAMWVPSAGNFQGWSGCSSLSVGDVTALTDQRDNQTYAVAKLADGKCWMIENLRLDAEYSSNESLAQGFGGRQNYGSFIGLANSESADFRYNSTTANSIYYINAQSGTASVNIGSTYYAGSRIPRYNNSNTSSSQTNPDSLGRSSAIYSYGNYYTWAAAMANTGPFSGPTATYDGKTSETINTSICPTGWRLPYGRNTGNGTTSGGFYNLDTAIRAGDTLTNAEAANRWRSYPNNFVLSGKIASSTISGRGTAGYYWSSTTVGESSSGFLANILGIGGNTDSSYMQPGTSSMVTAEGGSVRCVKISN